MDLNATGVLHRTANDEAGDRQKIFENIEKQSWKEWPNQAAFQGLDEHRGPIKLSVKGSIPGWAAGILYRTGPGQGSIDKTSKGTHQVTHWFDGFAHTHKFALYAPAQAGASCSVVYSSRRQSEAHVDQIKRMGWRCSTSFGQRADPCIGIFAKFMSCFVPQHPGNNVVCLPDLPGLTGSMHISSDHATMQQIDRQTLEPVGMAHQRLLHPHLSGPLSCAHAQRDPASGDWFNYNLSVGRLATYRVFRVSAATGKTDILATLAEPQLPAAYMHSFFLTPSYVVLCIPSTHFAWNGLKILWENNLIDALKPFDPARRCQWAVIDRHHARGVVARFSTPAGFFFHSVNAFERLVKSESGHAQTELLLDLALYDNFDFIHRMYYDVLVDRHDATYKAYFAHDAYKRSCSRHVRYRFKVPLAPQTRQEAQSAVADEVLSIPSPHSGELSTINPARATKSYRYVWGASTRGLSTFMDALVKTDLDTREAILWSGPPAHSPGEPVFVPRPGATQEDDGIVLSLVLDGSAQTSYLLCLDARTMVEVGRAEADFAIALGFHGFHDAAIKNDA
ncbi:hypothetical protein CDD81_7569 [Ophiocordyceps australis]|uniref:Carotenoid oxygenase n=1 Tax=Ophiocordyceps australis TaxID=1399860 RepID=A0A2C5Y324_9HYPO|nr:hypothetical protein CDD81_7569 [Ophiocordyceps australis]